MPPSALTRLPFLTCSLQAGKHEAYWKGLLARSSDVVQARTLKVPCYLGDALLVVPNAKIARLFETDVMQNAGGCAAVVTSGWGSERPGDLLFAMRGPRLLHAYVIVAHSYGYAVQRSTASYPSCDAPTRLCIRLERVGRGEQVSLQLGAKDGGIASKASDVKIYEIASSQQLRTLRMQLVVEVRCWLPLPFTLALSLPHTFASSPCGGVT